MGDAAAVAAIPSGPIIHGHPGRSEAESRDLHEWAMPYWVYIMASKRHGTLYTGVTNNLGRRVWEHREGHGSKFVRRYGVDLLVWAEAYENVVEAIAAEKRIKRWRRVWKIQLIENANPDWSDISNQAT